MTHHQKQRDSKTMMVTVAGGVLCVIVGMGVGLIIGFLVDPSTSQKSRPDMRSEFQQSTSRSKIKETLK